MSGYRICNYFQLQKLIRPLIKPATTLTLHHSADATQLSVNTKFGGIPYMEAGDALPICPICSRYLSFICQFNMSECTHQSNDESLYTFFYCLECVPWQSHNADIDQIHIKRYTTPSMDRAQRVASPGEQEYKLPPCNVAMEMINTVPMWDELTTISPEIADHCGELNPLAPWVAYDAAIKGLSEKIHTNLASQIGGYAQWIQTVSVTQCPICNNHMVLLAQIDSEDEANIMWGDMGMIYLFQCPHHLNQFDFELQCY